MKRILTLIVFCCVVLVLSAQSDALVRQKINEAASAMMTMQCDFVQTKQLKMLSDNIVSKGKIYYQKSDKLRCEYTSPTSYIFVMNGDKVLLRSKNRSRVIDVKKNKRFRGIARIMMGSVAGNSLSDEKNFQTTIATTPKEWIATMQPLKKDMKQMFQKIILHFNRQKAIISAIELIEKNGDKTHIELKNIRANETISENQFTVNK